MVLQIISLNSSVKRFVFLTLFITGCSLASARKDSTRLTNFRGFYVSTYYPYRFNSYYSQTGKYSDYYYTKFELKDYQPQTPGIGFGYGLSRNALFIKTDFNYWYGTKSLNDYFNFTAEDKEAIDPYSSFGYSPFSYPSVGYRYYKIKDHYTGTIKFHYFDIGFAVTGNITRFLRLYSGWRINHLMKYSYKAKIDRTASLYEVKRYNSQYDRVDSLLQTENMEYTNRAAEGKSVQTTGSFVFYNFGLNANFRIKKQLFFIDLVYESSRITPIQEGVIVNCLTFKLAYFFRYSNELGTE